MPPRSAALAALLPLSLGLGLFACPGPTILSDEGTTAADCSDLTDNDGDGLADCADDGCAKWSVCGGDDTGDSDADTDADADTDTDTDADSDTDTDTDWEMCINEFMASNSMTQADESGAYPDWIEIHNLTDAEVNLDGYTITDDLEDKEKHVLSDEVVLPASGYLLLWADGDVDQGGTHLSFKLSKGGESLGLYRPDGKAEDKLDYLAQATDQSAARMPDCTKNAWDIDETPTPGAANE